MADFKPEVHVSPLDRLSLRWCNNSSGSAILNFASVDDIEYRSWGIAIWKFVIYLTEELNTLYFFFDGRHIGVRVSDHKERYLKVEIWVSDNLKHGNCIWKIVSTLLNSGVIFTSGLTAAILDFWHTPTRGKVGSSTIETLLRKYG